MTRTPGFILRLYISWYESIPISILLIRMSMGQRESKSSTWGFVFVSLCVMPSACLCIWHTHNLLLFSLDGCRAEKGTWEPEKCVCIWAGQTASQPESFFVSALDINRQQSPLYAMLVEHFVQMLWRLCNFLKCSSLMFNDFHISTLGNRVGSILVACLVNQMTENFFFAFTFISLGDWPKQTLVQFMSGNVLPVFSSRSFIMSCHIFIFSFFSIVFLKFFITQMNLSYL